MTQSLVVSIDLCRRLGITPLRIKHLAEFFRLILAQHLPRIFFPFFLSKFETFFVKICAQCERYRNLMAGIFEIHCFFGNIAFPLASVKESKKEPTSRSAQALATLHLRASSCSSFVPFTTAAVAVTTQLWPIGRSPVVL